MFVLLWLGVGCVFLIFLVFLKDSVCLCKIRYELIMKNVMEIKGIYLVFGYDNVSGF